MLASFLDPQFKGLTFLDADEDKATVQAEVVNRMQKVSAKLPSESRLQKPDSPSSEAELPAKRPKETDWDIVGLEDEAATASGTSETEEGEVVHYHLEKIQPLSYHTLVL